MNASQNQPLARQYDLDWLRVIAIVIVLFFHVGMIFVPWGWHIKNDVVSESFKPIMSWSHQWRMPLLLFISGAGTLFALKRRSIGQYAKERHKRLLIPLLFGIFVIVPPQIYYERIEQFASFLQFYPDVFRFIPYPMGGSISWHHLWFVLYLLIYSIVSIPLLLWLSSERSQQFKERLIRYSNVRGSYLLFLIPLLGSQLLLRPYFPHETHDLRDLSFMIYYYLFFLGGLLIYSTPQLRQGLLKQRYINLFVAMMTVGMMIFLSHITPLWEAKQPLLIKQMWIMNQVVMAWSWVITIIGFGQRYLNRKSPILTQLNEAIYPFYILHQTVIVITGYYMIQWQASIAFKFFMISSVSLVASIAIYVIMIRPFNTMRFLFGMKPKRKKDYETKTLQVDVDFNNKQAV